MDWSRSYAAHWRVEGVRITGYTGGKILWLRDEEPDNFAKMKVFVCPKDYIRLKLTGNIAIDDGRRTGNRSCQSGSKSNIADS